VIEGYSVKDAAQVLGIPEGRIWELVARGVLAGTQGPDGSWRIHLGHTRPPEPAASPNLETRQGSDEPRHANGGRGGDVSPFRELLTEFRSLTERYGQALLALGEARGEVAALRSRVELLEARVDLRLPGPTVPPIGEPIEAAWQVAEQQEVEPEPEAATEAVVPDAVVPESWAPAVELDVTDQPAGAFEPAAPDAEVEPQPVEAVDVEVEESPDEAEIGEARGVVAFAPSPVPEPAPDEPAPVVEEREDETGAAPRRRRASSTHSALAGLAEALARAVDPALDDLTVSDEEREGSAAIAMPEASGMSTDAPAEAGPMEPLHDDQPEPILAAETGDAAEVSAEAAEPPAPDGGGDDERARGWIEPMTPMTDDRDEEVEAAAELEMAGSGWRTEQPTSQEMPTPDEAPPQPAAERAGFETADEATGVEPAARLPSEAVEPAEPGMTGAEEPAGEREPAEMIIGDLGDDPFPDQGELGDELLREYVASGLPEDVEPFDWEFGASGSHEDEEPAAGQEASEEIGRYGSEAIPDAPPRDVRLEEPPPDRESPRDVRPDEFEPEPPPDEEPPDAELQADDEPPQYLSGDQPPPDRESPRDVRPDEFEPEPPSDEVPATWQPPDEASSEDVSMDPEPSVREVELPGGEELQDALRALGLPVEDGERSTPASDASAPEPQSAPPQPPRDEPPQPPQWPAGSRSDRSQPAHRPAPGRAQPRPPSVAEPDWLRNRRDPAATAFRRLRRLFPG
jgi:hypothetical protein